MKNAVPRSQARNIARDSRRSQFAADAIAGIIAGIVAFPLPIAFVSTFIAGVLLIIFGLARFGTAIRFIPHPVATGFMSGIAVIIISGQVKALIGLNLENVPPGFIGKWTAQAHAQAIGA